MLCLATACGGKRHHKARPAFYYWKTVYELNAYERATIERSGAKRIYMRLFDVDRASNGPAYPVAALRMSRRAEPGIAYVPVIFITQKAIAGIAPAEVIALATKINGLAAGICSQAGIAPPEIQIDCDWTASTRESYFALLRALKQQTFFKGRTLSCTIRLHQVKYSLTTGVPPADRGALMCYNIGNIRKPGAHNSILEAEEAKKYLGAIDVYPLPLDIALPLFSWSLLFHNSHFVGILRDVAPASVARSSLFRKEGANLYRCRRDTVWNGYEIRKGDVVRTERPDAKDIAEIASFTAARLRNRDLHLIFFSCDSVTLSDRDTNELETYLDAYR